MKVGGRPKSSKHMQKETSKGEILALTYRVSAAEAETCNLI